MTAPLSPVSVRVQLGNVGALDAASGDLLPGDRHVTTVAIPPGRTLVERFLDVVDPTDGLWRAHSTAAPAWVESSDPVLAGLLASHFDCPVGCPDGWAA